MRRVIPPDYESAIDDLAHALKRLDPLLQHWATQSKRNTAYEAGLLAQRTIRRIYSPGNLRARISFWRAALPSTRYCNAEELPHDIYSLEAYNTENLDDPAAGEQYPGWADMIRGIVSYARIVHGGLPIADFVERLEQRAARVRPNLYRNQSGEINFNLYYHVENTAWWCKVGVSKDVE